MKIEQISKQTYDNYLKQVKVNTFLQKSEMSEVLKANNSETEFLGLVDNEEVLAVALVVIRKIFLGVRVDLMTGAISTNPENEYIFYEKLKDYAKQINCLELVVKPDKNYCNLDQEGNVIGPIDSTCSDNMQKIGYIVNDGSIGTFEGSPDYHFVKDLSGFSHLKEDELLKSFNGNAQRKIKKGKDMDIRVRALTKDELEEFNRLTLETSRRQHFSDLPLEYYQTFYDMFSESAEFLVSEIDINNSITNVTDRVEKLKESPKAHKQEIQSLSNEIKMLEEFRRDTDANIIQLADMLIIYLESQAIYFVGGSSTKYQKIPGAFVIQFEAMKRTIERDIPLYNFFGVEGKFDGSDGVLRFKQNFNGYIIRKVGAFIYYPHPMKYKMIQFLKGIRSKLKL